MAARNTAKATAPVTAKAREGVEQVEQAERVDEAHRADEHDDAGVGPQQHHLASDPVPQRPPERPAERTHNTFVKQYNLWSTRKKLQEKKSKHFSCSKERLLKL